MRFLKIFVLQFWTLKTIKRREFLSSHYLREFSPVIVEKTVYSLHGELSRLQYDTTWLSKQYLVAIIQLNISCGIKISYLLANLLIKLLWHETKLHNGASRLSRCHNMSGTCHCCHPALACFVPPGVLARPAPPTHLIQARLVIMRLSHSAGQLQPIRGICLP